MNPILAVLAGLIASAAFHPIDFWPALIVGIGILYKLNMDQPIKSRLLINFLFGIGYQLLTLYWVGTYVGSFAWIALVLMQAVFVIALSFSTGALTFAASWILFEFILRSIPFGGFGWSRLGFALTESPLNYLYPRLSIIGVAFIFVLAITLIVDQKFKGLVITLLLFILAGFIPVQVTKAESVKVALIQGGQQEKLDNTFENANSAISKHFKAMKKVEPDSVDLVVWPENAIMHDPTVRKDTRMALESEYKRINAPILVNANLKDGTNGSVLFDGSQKQSYSKRYLTPFGEFIPFQSLVEKISDKAGKVVPYIPGREPYIFKAGDFSFRTLICYELLSDKQARAEMTDTDFIVTQTNNATYFKTWQLEQELAIAQARSAETSRQSAYVSTTGVTAIIDERGKIQKSIPKYENQTLVDNIYVRSGSTLAAKYGNVIEISIILLLFLSFAKRLKSRLRFKRDLTNL